MGIQIKINFGTKITKKKLLDGVYRDIFLNFLCGPFGIKISEGPFRV